MRWPFQRLLNGSWRRRRKRIPARDESYQPYRPLIRRLEDRRVLDVSAAFTSATGQLEILITNTADTANISISGGNLVVTDRQNQNVAIQVDGQGPGTVSASDVDSIRAAGDAAADQTVIFHSPFALPNGLLVDGNTERVEIHGAITRVTGGDIQSEANVTQLGADLEVTGNDILLRGDVILSEDVTLSAVDVIFDGQVDDDGSTATTSRLLVRSSGLTRFAADVGSISRLDRLETDAAGRTELNGSLATSGGAILLADPVTLTQSVQLSDSGSIGIIFGSTVNSATDGHFQLTLTANAGRVEFNGNIGTGNLGDQRLGGLTIEQAQSGVRFGGTDGIAAVHVLGNIDLGTGTQSIGGEGVVFNGGTSALALATFGGALRINGAVALQSDVAIATSNGNVTFTADAPLDSALDRAQSLIIDAGGGAVFFNEDIGGRVALRGLTITRADAGVVFGAGDAEMRGGAGPVDLIHSVEAVVVGAGANAIRGGIVFNAGNGRTLNLITTGDDVVLNGPVTLNSSVSIDTGTGPGNIAFASGPVDSQATEANNLTLRAGTGRVSFSNDIGASQPLGTFIVTQADAGVIFGTADAANPVTGEGPVSLIRANGLVDIGTADNEIGGVGVRLNGGTSGLLSIRSASGNVRLNGPVTLGTNVSIASGGDLVFTNDAPVDSAPGRASDLSLDAPNGSISLNEDMGRTAAIGMFTVVRARDGLSLGGAVSELPGSGGLGPMEAIVASAVDLGTGTNVIGGSGILLNGSANAAQQFTVAGGARFNGAVLLATDVTLQTGGDILFTHAAAIDSAAGRTGSLTLDAGGARVRFNEDIGSTRAIGSLRVVRAAGGVWFGEAGVESTSPDGAGPVNTIRADHAVDLGVGSNPLPVGIFFQGGAAGTVVSTTDHDVRLNGPVHLQSDLAIRTGDGLGNVTFTRAATIDSSDGFGALTRNTRSDLVIDAGDGSVFFNADLGQLQPLDALTIIRAAQAVIFGQADTATIGGTGFVSQVRTDGDIQIGAGNAPDHVIGSVVLNGGAGTLALVTSGDDVRVNGATTLQSTVSINTGSGGGDAIFTVASPVISQTGEANSLELTLGSGNAVFGAALGSTARLGTLLLRTVADASFASSITAARIVQEAGTGTTLFAGSINTNAPLLAGLELAGNAFRFQAPVLATGNGQVNIRHTGLLDFDPGADMRLDGSFHELGGGAVDLAGDLATSADLVTFEGPVRLTDGATGGVLISTVAGGNPAGATIRLGPSLEGQSPGAESLLLNAGSSGDLDFTGAVGTTIRLGSITTVAARHVTFRGDVAAARFVQLDGTGTTTFALTLDLNHAGLPALVAQSANLTFDGLVTTSGQGSVQVTVSGVLHLSDRADMLLNGSFRQLGGGIVRTAANMATSGDDVSFAGAVTLVDDIIINTGTGPGTIVFERSLDGSQPFQQDLRVMAGAGNLRFVGAVGQNTSLASVFIEQAHDVFVGGATTLGTLTQMSGTGETRIQGRLESQVAGSTISLRNWFITVDAAIVGADSTVELRADEDLSIQALVSANDVPVTLLAADDVRFGSNAGNSTRGGSIVVSADLDLSGDGGVAMADGAVLQSLLSGITITAGTNIQVSRLIAPQLISLSSRLGGVVDAGDSGPADIESPRLVIRAATGIGSNNPLETRVPSFAALNSAGGGIRIVNDVGGLLTIGIVDGLAGITDGGSGNVEITNAGALHIDRGVLNRGGGDTILRAEIPGDLVVNAPIQNTGGDGFIYLFAGGDLVIRNSLPEPRDAQGNPIENPANPEQFFEIYVVGEGGIRGQAVGDVVVDDGDQDYVIVRTATGQVTNVPPIVSIDAIDQGGSDLDEFGRGFVQVTLGDKTHLETNYHITIDWGDGEIENFPIPGTINPLRAQFKGNTDARFVSGEGEQEGVYVFLHKYFANPNPNDPSAPIPIRVEVRYDARSSGSVAIDGNRPASGSAVFNGIQFTNQVSQEIFTTRTEIFTVPGTGGAGFVKVVESTIVPVELRMPTTEPPVRFAAAFSGTSGMSYQFTTIQFDIEAQQEYRVFMRVVDDVLNREGEDIPLDVSVLDDPVALFRKNRFPNGHYRIYLEELRTHRTRVILDVYIYNGRVVPPNFREGAAERIEQTEQAQPPMQPQPNDNGMVLPAESVGGETVPGIATEQPADAEAASAGHGDRAASNSRASSSGAGPAHDRGHVASR